MGRNPVWVVHGLGWRCSARCHRLGWRRTGFGQSRRQLWDCRLHGMIAGVRPWSAVGRSVGF
eukprot:7293993-Alexandrium_andersonii.AAC.1